MSSDRRDAAQYKPKATTATTTGIFGIGKRTKVEPAISPPANPLADKYLAVEIEVSSNGRPSKASIGSKRNLLSTAVSLTYESDHPANSGQDYQSTSPALLHWPSDSSNSAEKVHHAPSHRFLAQFTLLTSSLVLPRPALKCSHPISRSTRLIQKICYRAK